MAASKNSKSAGTARAKPEFRCSECGWQTVKWVGRCGECHAWGTVEEMAAAPLRSIAVPSSIVPAKPIAEISATAAQAIPTGIGELDRVLGGGLVPGAVILMAGEPGVGKSTLLLDVGAKYASSGKRVLYLTGEESAEQVRIRAERIGALYPRLYLAATADLGTVLAHMEESTPDLCIVDSVQTIAAAEVEGSAGGVSQVRQVATSVIRAAKEKNIATVLVGHVTKDGTIAGPRTLEHLVDVVCHFEGERHSRLRLMRAVKNRYGPTDEVGCFDLTEDGIHGLPDPSGLFLSPTSVHASGSCVTVTLEGRRPLVTEIQALVAESSLSNPRRTTSGLDSSRVAMLQAVILRRTQAADVSRSDIYVATVGGAKCTEPSTDLAAALAIISSARDIPLPESMVAFGEVGLAGELRQCTGIDRRLAEAGRLGFTHAIVPPNTAKAPDGMTVHHAATLREAWVIAETAVEPGSRKGRR